MLVLYQVSAWLGGYPGRPRCTSNREPRLYQVSAWLGASWSAERYQCSASPPRPTLTYSSASAECSLALRGLVRRSASISATPLAHCPFRTCSSGS
eukprot:1168699-Prorocentrum_minimum.AAC.2